MTIEEQIVRYIEEQVVRYIEDMPVNENMKNEIRKHYTKEDLLFPGARVSLSDLFTWGETIQGFRFWSNVNRCLYHVRPTVYKDLPLGGIVI